MTDEDRKYLLRAFELIEVAMTLAVDTRRELEAMRMASDEMNPRAFRLACDRSASMASKRVGSHAEIFELLHREIEELRRRI